MLLSSSIEASRLDATPALLLPRRLLLAIRVHSRRKARCVLVEEQGTELVFMPLIITGAGRRFS